MRKFLNKKITRILSPIRMQAYSLIFVEIIVGMMISAASFIYFIKIAKNILEQEGILIDTAISHGIYSLRNPLLTDAMLVISSLGGAFLLVATSCVVLYLLIKGYYREAFLLTFAVLVGYFLNYLIKYLLQVPRPTIDPLTLASFYSFPSGHAMGSFIFYATLTYLIFHFTRRITLTLSVCLLFGLIVLLTGFSRVYLGVHYPSDVVAGYIAGFWWVVTVIVLDKTLNFYRIFKKKKSVK